MEGLRLNAAHRLRTKLVEFRAWLSGCGAQVMEPTNEWELVRFKTGKVTCVIYTNKSGGLRFSGPDAETAYKAWKEAKPWRAAPAVNRKSGTPLAQAIRARDGDNCFFCLKFVSPDNQSIEHLVPVTHRGPNHISNLFLAHKLCNQKAGHLSAVEKIRIHTGAAVAAAQIEDKNVVWLPPVNIPLELMA